MGDIKVYTGPKIKYDQLTEPQKEIAGKVLEWHKSKKTKKNQIIRINGQPGSGKSFLLRYLCGRLKLTEANCLVMAYTGQATNELLKNHIHSRTIHSATMNTTEVAKRNAMGEIMRDEYGDPLYTLAHRPVESLPPEIELLIIDEGSFLPKYMEDRLAKYGIPILITGDIEQLGPVSGEPSFTASTITHTLEGIVRQDANSKLYKYCSNIRRQVLKHDYTYMSDVTLLRGAPTITETFLRYIHYFAGADVIIVANNQARQQLTDLYRQHIIGARTPYPVKGEKVICRANEWDITSSGFVLTNGTQGIVAHTIKKDEIDFDMQTYRMTVNPTQWDGEPFRGLLCDMKFLNMPFYEEKFDKRRTFPGIKIEYGHAITAHLVQGAQYENVLFFDNAAPVNSSFMKQVRTTACSRASKHLIHIIPPSHEFFAGRRTGL